MVAKTTNSHKCMQIYEWLIYVRGILCLYYIFIYWHAFIAFSYHIYMKRYLTISTNRWD